MQCLIEKRLRYLGFYCKFRSGLVSEEVFIHHLEHLPRRLAVAPLGNDVRGDCQQICVRIAHTPQITRAQEPQIRLLRQILNIDARP